MKPHMAYINNTLIRKKLAEDAKETSTSKYREKVRQALDSGHSHDAIVAALEAEKLRIAHDERDGDSLFKQGVKNSKTSCLNALNLLISELKGDQK